MADRNDDYFYGLFGGLLFPPLILLAVFANEDDPVAKGLSHAFIVWFWWLCIPLGIAVVLSFLGGFHGL